MNELNSFRMHYHSITFIQFDPSTKFSSDWTVDSCWFQIRLLGNNLMNTVLHGVLTLICEGFCFCFEGLVPTKQRNWYETEDDIERCLRCTQKGMHTVLLVSLWVSWDQHTYYQRVLLWFHCLGSRLGHIIPIFTYSCENYRQILRSYHDLPFSFGFQLIHQRLCVIHRKWIFFYVPVSFFPPLHSNSLFSGE